MDITTSETIFSIVASCPGISIENILAEKGISQDAIYSAIAIGLIYFDLCSASLVEPNKCFLFKDCQTANEFSTNRSQSNY